MTGTPQQAGDIETEFPGWEAFRGVNLLWYARLLLSSPPVVLRGESLTDLRDQIIGWRWRRSFAAEEQSLTDK